MKTTKSILLIFSLLLVSVCSFAQEHKSLTKFITFEEAVAASKKNPKPILIDIYTQWCGPCKLMTKNTFGDEKVAKYLNENFYCVKFDAEGFDTVKLEIITKDTIRENGKIVKIQEKPFTIKFANPAPIGTSKSPHQFASSILDGKLMYPSLVFLSPNINRLEIKPGYLTPQQFEPIIKFYGSGAYQKQSYEEFSKTFTPTF